jgi:hypothetical protein
VKSSVNFGRERESNRYIAGVLIILSISTPLYHALGVTVGMFNVYFPLDEAMGYREVGDDISEVYDAGITLFHHYFQDEYSRTRSGERFWGGLPVWLSKHSEKRRALNRLKGKFGARLGWRLFFWEYYLEEVKRQTDGKGRAVIGEMYAMFALRRWWDELERFVDELCRFESENFPGGIAGWYIAEEPNSPRKRYSPKLCEELIRRIRAAEEKGGWRRHRIYVDISASDPPRKVIPFIKLADVVMISPDAYIWAAARPRDMSRYDRIPLAVSRMRSYLAQTKNKEAEVHIVLQAYQPLTNLQMHQQIRLALVDGEKPPDGIWFWWWHDCKSAQLKGRRMIRINRWDEETEYAWREAISSELSRPKGKAVILKGEHRWSGDVYVIGDLIVTKGSRLSIEPGTLVRFSPMDRFGGGIDPRRCELIVEGELIAEGTDTRPILFSSGSNIREFWYPPRNPSQGDWYGIRSSGIVRMKNYRIKHALQGEISREAPESGR